MKCKSFWKLPVLFAVIGSVIGCSSSQKGDRYSDGTGWDLSGKEGGTKYQTDYEDQEPGPGLILVEGGTYTMGKVQDDPMKDWNNTPTQQHVQSFYIDEHEVTNVMYLEYLDWLKKTFPPSESNFKNIYYGALPDTLVWRNPLGFNENMTNNYLRHPASHNYPVVGVTWLQAVEFSKWRTDRVNEKKLEQEKYTGEEARFNSESGSVFSTETYINSPTQVYGGDEEKLLGGKNSEDKGYQDENGEQRDKFVQLKDGILLPDYRLPTESEWEYAALGQSSIRDYNSYRGRKKYPWDGQYTRSNNRKTLGDQKANFKQGTGDYGGIAGWSDDGADITTQVMSYEPNDYGLYDMAGNVAEWVADVYRPIIDNEFNDFNYYRGNSYTKNVINDDGTVKVLDPTEVVYDTLANGKIVATNLPGEIKKQALGEEETYLRTQFDESYNVDYRDGDQESSIYFDQTNVEVKNKMYNSPENEISVDPNTGEMVRNRDKSDDRTTLIDDEVRVYKGGSWRDRAYWLDPAQRRYYPQHMSTDFIGFRNAMSRVGSKSGQKGRSRK
jgi:gliding motility-associated lipoprotein GldJ